MIACVCSRQLGVETRLCTKVCYLKPTGKAAGDVYLHRRGNSRARSPHVEGLCGLRGVIKDTKPLCPDSIDLRLSLKEAAKVIELKVHSLLLIVSSPEVYV